MWKKYWIAVCGGVAIWAAGAGCVQRTLTVRSDPPGALVYLNDQEIGRTPLTRNFMWYGIYDVELRKAGYESIKTTSPVIAPWWQWVPMDFFAEFFPLTDHHDMSFTLRLPNEREMEADRLVKDGEQLKGELELSQKPTTQPTTRPHDHHKPPKTMPATRASGR